MATTEPLHMHNSAAEGAVVPADTMPRGLLLAMAALVLVSLLAVGGSRLNGVSTRVADAPVVTSRSLHFEDRSDGSVAILDARSGREIERVQGEAGFLRGALRALTRERRMRNLGPEVAFELLGRADGRLTLADPATGQRIDLESFGPDNAASFARLLPAAGTPRASTELRRSTP